MIFTAAELRLLAIADRNTSSAPLVGRSRRGRPRTGYLGDLADLVVHALHEQGASRQEIARLAGVIPDTVSEWRRRRGLCRPYRYRGAA